MQKAADAFHSNVRGSTCLEELPGRSTTFRAGTNRVFGNYCYCAIARRRTDKRTSRLSVADRADLPRRTAVGHEDLSRAWPGTFVDMWQKLRTHAAFGDPGGGLTRGTGKLARTRSVSVVLFLMGEISETARAAFFSELTESVKRFSCASTQRARSV